MTDSKLIKDAKYSIKMVKNRIIKNEEMIEWHKGDLASLTRGSAEYVQLLTTIIKLRDDIEDDELLIDHLNKNLVQLQRVEADSYDDDPLDWSDRAPWGGIR